MAGYAILTRYAGPTNYRGSRIIARGPSLTADGPMVRATVGYDHDLDSGTVQHRRAAVVVAAKLRAAGWNVTLSDDWYALPDGTGYAFTLVYGTDR